VFTESGPPRGRQAHAAGEVGRDRAGARRVGLARVRRDALLCFDPMPSHVDYALARRAVLRDLRRGAVTRLDVCDAHPELLRAARNVGEPAPHDCPICGSERVRYVSYVYGDTLKQANGRCITHDSELAKLDASFDEFACYVVEVCLDCGWNHLDRRYLLGRRHAG
jgi:acyl dehydratase